MLSHCRFFTQLFIPRSGSHYLRTLLQSHPDIGDFAFEEGWNGRIGTNQLLRLGTSNLRETYEQWKLVGLRANGCLVVDYDRFNMLEDKVVINWRNNKLKQYISLKLAVNHRFIWTSYQKQITIDLPEATRIINRWLHAEEVMRERIDGLWVEYNEVVDGSGVRKVLDFLGLQQKELESQLPKQSSKPHLDYVLNPEVIYDSHLLRWLYEP